jgi:hypothetical protein
MAIRDSQDDSQVGVCQWTTTHEGGQPMFVAERQRTVAGGRGWQTRGLQNRLRGAAEASFHTSRVPDET